MIVYPMIQLRMAFIFAVSHRSMIEAAYQIEIVEYLSYAMENV